MPPSLLQRRRVGDAGSCDHAARVPAVHVREGEGAADSVPRQSADIPVVPGIGTHSANCAVDRGLQEQGCGRRSCSDKFQRFVVFGTVRTRSSWTRFACPCGVYRGSGPDVQKTVEVPQLPFSGQVCMPVVVQRQVLGCGPHSADVQFLDKVFLPVVMQVFWSRRAENCGRPGVAVPDRVRRVWVRRVVHARGVAENRGDSAGAVPGQVCCARRYAMTGAQFLADIPQVQFMDLVVVVPVVQ